MKQTAAKLKFTLKGSVSRDQEYLQMALQSSRDRLHDLEEGVESGQSILSKATEEPLEINVSVPPMLDYCTYARTHIGLYYSCCYDYPCRLR